MKNFSLGFLVLTLIFIFGTIWLSGMPGGGIPLSLYTGLMGVISFIITMILFTFSKVISTRILLVIIGGFVLFVVFLIGVVYLSVSPYAQ